MTSTENDPSQIDSEKHAPMTQALAERMQQLFRRPADQLVTAYDPIQNIVSVAVKEDTPPLDRFACTTILKRLHEFEATFDEQRRVLTVSRYLGPLKDDPAIGENLAYAVWRAAFDHDSVLSRHAHRNGKNHQSGQGWDV